MALVEQLTLNNEHSLVMSIVEHMVQGPLVVTSNVEVTFELLLLGWNFHHSQVRLLR